MRVKTWVEILQEVEVDVDRDAVLASITYPETVVHIISRLGGILRAITKDQISTLTQEQKETIETFFREQAMRFTP